MSGDEVAQQVQGGLVEPASEGQLAEGSPMPLVDTSTITAEGNPGHSNDGDLPFFSVGSFPSLNSNPVTTHMQVSSLPSGLQSIYELANESDDTEGSQRVVCADDDGKAVLSLSGEGVGYRVGATATPPRQLTAAERSRAALRPSSEATDHAEQRRRSQERPHRQRLTGAPPVQVVVVLPSATHRDDSILGEIPHHSSSPGVAGHLSPSKP